MARRSLRILTLNVKMLPGPFGNGGADLTRAEHIAAYINRATPRYDVICLQEVFDEEVRDRLIQAFARYALIPKSHDNDIFHEDSGLFFANGGAIRGHGFEEFKASAGDDSLADKGIFGARLDTVDALGGVTLCVFHTHMQAAYKSLAQHADVRARQLDQIRRYIQRAIAKTHPSRVAVLLLGDLNIVGESAEYRDMLRRLGSPRDLYREAHPNDPGYTYHGKLNHQLGSASGRRRLDYVLAFDTVAVPNQPEPVALRPLQLQAASVVRPNHSGRHLSDHFGVEVVVAA